MKTFKIMAWFYEGAKRIDLDTLTIKEQHRYGAYDALCRLQGRKVHCAMITEDGKYFEIIPGRIHDTWRDINGDS